MFPGAIFYETHFAPLLRMQGFFNEVALDLVTADGRKLAVLANALERRDQRWQSSFHAPHYIPGNRTPPLRT